MKKYLKFLKEGKYGPDYINTKQNIQYAAFHIS